MTEEIYDVVVLGGGAGGVAAAIRAAQFGGRVAIVEKNTLGGLCMNRGCIPFGHMMVASRILGGLSLAKEMGLNFSSISKDYGALRKRQNELIDFMRLGVKSTLNKNNIRIIEGTGKIAGRGKIEVAGEVISCRNIILATGSKWLKPDFPGADLKTIITTDELLREDKLPERVFLYGRSPWMTEIAQFLNRFGSQTILAAQKRNILPGESKTIASRLTKVLKEEGVVIKTQVEIETATQEKDGIHVLIRSKEGPESIVVDKIVYIERGAGLNDLGLGTIDLDERSPYLKVTGKMEAGVNGVYAIGDLTGPQSRHYSHWASTQGIVAAENAMGENSEISPRAFTRVLFTQPQIACVGLTPKEAKEAGYDVLGGTAPLSMNPFGMIISEIDGIVEVVADKKYGEILGIHIIAKAASEMAGQAVLAIQMEMTVEELSKISFPHPTLSESLAEAARDALGRPIYLP